MRGLSVCSGIGGLDLTAEAAGITVIGQVEWDEACIRVLEKHWPDTPRLKDLKEVNGDEFGEYDIFFGGIPCQPYSIAGKKEAENDPRDLWPAAFRIIRATRPRWVVIENVANFTRLALDRVWADLEGEGYSVGATILPACAFGPPHQRERTFTLAHTSGTRLERDQHRRRSHGQRTDGRSITTNRGQREIESRMGRAVDGITRRLDTHRWPARPYQEQAEWEAPRVIETRLAGHADRLKQLGNAVVWAQAYPVFELLVQIDQLI